MDRKPENPLQTITLSDITSSFITLQINTFLQDFSNQGTHYQQSQTKVADSALQTLLGSLLTENEEAGTEAVFQ